MRRVPVSLQAAQTECGLCAARSLLAFHGQDVSLSTLRATVEPGRDGLSLRQIAVLLRLRGLEATVYRVKAAAGLELLDGPFIAHWKGHHFVVVERLTRSGATVMDPMTGRTRVPRADLEQDFSGHVLVARPGEGFTRGRRPLFAAWRDKPIWPVRAGWTYTATALLSLAVFCFTLTVPLLTERLVNRSAAPEARLPEALAVVLAAACGYVATQVVRAHVTTRLVRAVSWQLLTSAFERLVRLPLKYFVSRPPGELMYRLNSTTTVRDIIATKVVQGVLDAVTALVLIGYVFWIAVPLGVVVLTASSLVVVLLVASRRLVREAVDDEVHHNAQMQALQMDAVVSIANLRIGGYADTYLDDWRASYRDALTAMVRRMRIQQGWIGSAVAGLQAFAPLAVLVLSLSWAREGTVTLGQAVAVQGVSGLLFALTSSVFQSWTDGTVASRHLERVEDIYTYPEEVSGGQRSALPHTGITLRGVGFRYTDHSEDVLTGVDLDVAAGSVVAVVGESGSGKTTLGKVLCSLYPPSRGSISFGGVPLEEFDLQSLRREIGYIPQEGYLHNRTLVSNLTLGTGIGDDEAVGFCRSLPFMAFVDDLPMGYHTVVSSMGTNFSGGQRQRIAIAKALVRRPRILVLDEATSALDNTNQSLVHQVVADQDCTQIVIAHRLSTVIDADLVVVLADGRVEDVGTHRELSRRGGSYGRMFGTGSGKRVEENALG